jgi:signal transduction histidine kinase
MAERIDARIEVESAVGRGTTFTLMLATSGPPD